MELYLIEVCDFDDKCHTIRRGVRASLETAKTLVSKLIDEYIRQDYTIVAETPAVSHFDFISGNALMWDMWSNNGQHDLYIRLSKGRMDTQEHRLWIDNEDDGKMFESNEEMTEYLINNYDLWSR